MLALLWSHLTVPAMYISPDVLAVHKAHQATEHLLRSVRSAVKTRCSM